MAKTPQEMADVGAEFSHQTALFAWAAMAIGWGVECAKWPEAYTKDGWARENFGDYAKNPHCVPELKWLHAIKNQGHGDAIRGGRSKAEGVKPGVFDTFLPVPREVQSTGFNGIVSNSVSRYNFPVQCGLYLELKKPGKNSTSKLQEDFQADMRALGYAAEVVVGWIEGRDTLLRYLGRA